MLKVVDKQAIVVIKQVVIVETITTTKECTEWTVGEGEGCFFNFSLLLLPAS